MTSPVKPSEQSFGTDNFSGNAQVGGSSASGMSQGAPGPEVADGVDEGAEPATEGRSVKGRKCPRQPSADEVEAHNRSHWPHRDWCPYCVGANGGRIPPLEHSRW